MADSTVTVGSNIHCHLTLIGVYDLLVTISLLKKNVSSLLSLHLQSPMMIEWNQNKENINVIGAAKTLNLLHEIELLFEFLFN